MSERQLVMDVGMYDGNDTAYYLHRGFRVIAIDANPRMITRGRLRFNNEIRSGQLILLNLAICQKAGISTLYICNRDKGKSTMNRQILIAGGEGSIEELEVPCIVFSDILAEYGTPHYLKIDIEESDHLCIEAIDPAFPPKYVSWEAGEDTVQCLNLMYGKGYRCFKIINQLSFYDVPTINLFRYRATRKLRSILRLKQPLYSPHRDWTFVRGHSSGPCCEDISGRWLPFEETVRIWTSFCKNKTSWFDIHASL